MDDLQQTWFIASGHRANRFANAVAYDSDEVIVDRDESGSAPDKPFARDPVVTAFIRWLAGQTAPWDTPSLEIRDGDAVTITAHTARRLGMGGKLGISPIQPAPAAAAVVPGPWPDELGEVRRLLQMTSGGSATKSFEDAQQVYAAAGESP